MEEIDSLELAQNLIRENHNNERDPYKRTIILEKIVKLQHCIFNVYYEARKQLEDSYKKWILIKNELL